MSVIRKLGIESLAIQYSCEVRPKCSRFMSLPSCEMVRLVYLTSGIGKVSWREVDVDWVFGLPHEYSMSLLLPVQSRIKLHQCSSVYAREPANKGNGVTRLKRLA